MNLKSIQDLNNKLLQLNRQIFCLKTDLIRFQLLTNCYEKYIHFLQLIRDKNIINNNILLEENEFKQQLIVLKSNKFCKIELNLLQNNYNNEENNRQNGI